MTNYVTKHTVELLCIIDKSGSLGGDEESVERALRRIMATLKAKMGILRLTTILFDAHCYILYDHVAVEDAHDLALTTYEPSGSTALLDAMGFAINSELRYLEEVAQDSTRSQIICVIISDGYDNASRNYDYNQIEQLVATCAEQGWKFIFLDAEQELERLVPNIDTNSTFPEQWKKHLGCTRYVSASDLAAIALRIEGMMRDED